MSRALMLREPIVAEVQAAEKERDAARGLFETRLRQVESGPSPRAKCILIVDDDPAVGRVLRTILDRSIQGVIDTVDNIDDAIQRCSVIGYDVVLVDLRLHHEPLGGARLIGSIKKTSRSAKAKIVLITGNSDPTRTTDDLALARGRASPGGHRARLPRNRRPVSDQEGLASAPGGAWHGMATPGGAWHGMATPVDARHDPV
jgi:CheY-like chemotaxis protein